ncbi:Vacuolar protein-sorting-associated protein 28, partial [Spiromyces aspiralis]
MEVRLYNNIHERDMYDRMADLYSILISLERLEYAFIRDYIPATEYQSLCYKLISQYRATWKLLEHEFSAPQDFVTKYKVNCQAALNRIQVGVPATVEHGAFGTNSSSAANKRSVAEATEKFITLMDAVKLNQVSVDTLHPRLGDLLESLNNVDGLNRNSTCRTKLLEWLKQLNSMRASDQLDEDQARQFMFEI